MSVYKKGTDNIQRLSEIFDRPLPLSILVLGYLVPYSIAYLVYIPNTRTIRIALYPLGLFCLVWVIMKAPGKPGRFKWSCVGIIPLMLECERSGSCGSGHGNGPYLLLVRRKDET